LTIPLSRIACALAFALISVPAQAVEPATVPDAAALAPAVTVVANSGSTIAATGYQLEPVNGTGRWLKDLNKRNRSSAPPSLNGPLYYRPNRMHQYLSATELRDAAENEEALRYGRPTRTT